MVVLYTPGTYSPCPHRRTCIHTSFLNPPRPRYQNWLRTQQQKKLQVTSLDVHRNVLHKMHTKSYWRDTKIKCHSAVGFAWGKGGLSKNKVNQSINVMPHGPEEMAQWLRVLRALAKDSALAPSTHIRWLTTISKFSPRKPNASSFCGHMNLVRTCLQTHTHRHYFKNYLKKNSAWLICTRPWVWFPGSHQVA